MPSPSVVRALEIRCGNALLRMRAALAALEIGPLRYSRFTGIRTFTTRDELLALYRAARDLPPNSNAVEFGSYHGASTCFIAAGLARSGGRLYCIDNWESHNMPEKSGGDFEVFQKNLEAYRDVVTPIRAQAKDIIPDMLPGLIDFAFIDGDHSHAGVRNDLTKILPRLTAQATLAFHDVRWFQGVSVAIGELLSSGEWAIWLLENNLIVLKRCQEWSHDSTQSGPGIVSPYLAHRRV